jgi:branched-chain amino acid aminotransferase
MITCEWSAQTGWSAPKMGPYGPLSLAPTASVLHYATECYEGMKLYRGRDQRLRIFRPDLNAKRFRRSSIRCTLPDFDPEEMVKLIVALCAIDGPKFLPKDPLRELPDAGPNFIANRLLYIRPTMIGTDPDLGIKPPQTAMLFIIISSFPSMDTLYLSRPAPGLRLLASPSDAVRAWPGGCGAAKLGANYGPSLLAQSDAMRQGYDQVLWLYSQPGSTDPGEQGRVTEAGASNFFVVWRTRQGALELCTAPTSDGTILEGVTRQSVLDLGAQRLEAALKQEGVLAPEEHLEVNERWFTMADVLEATKEGRLLEAFAAGTAVGTPPQHMCTSANQRLNSTLLLRWLRFTIKALMLICRPLKMQSGQ